MGRPTGVANRNSTLLWYKGYPLVMTNIAIEHPLQMGHLYHGYVEISTGYPMAFSTFLLPGFIFIPSPCSLVLSQTLARKMLRIYRDCWKCSLPSTSVACPSDGAPPTACLGCWRPSRWLWSMKKNCIIHRIVKYHSLIWVCLKMGYTPNEIAI